MTGNPKKIYKDYQNLHTHTTYCDGAQTAREMIEAAIVKGCGSIGFSEHSNVRFVERKYSMSPDVVGEYMREIKALKEEYKGRIEVFLGIEQDYDSDPVADVFDYVIGTVHHVIKEDQYITVDCGAGTQKRIVCEYYHGDYYAFANDYYEKIAVMAKKIDADIVGHFDVMTKNNFRGSLFDETDPRYVASAINAMEEILKDCRLFEVNTGAMYRVGKPDPYPSPLLLKELRMRGGEVILTSDSHSADSLCFKFDEMCELLRSCGFRYVKRLTENGFVDDTL